jgi:ERF superfamily
VQTTSIDQAAGIIDLTTVLAHSSGEWIASDWPVCPVSETATPHRMGAALTYARRYALFTLVGIAGEDDLDAPDLTTPTNRTSGDERAKLNGSGQSSGGRRSFQPQATPRRDGKGTHKAIKPVLGAETSAELRNRLIAEVDHLGSGDDAAIWAHRSLGEKNRLTATDARELEHAFQIKLETLTKAPDELAGAWLTSQVKQASVIDKSVLALPKPRRVRDRDHVKFVAQQACLVCERRPSDAHHLRFAQSRALARKVSDEYTVPLCRGHHRQIHRFGDELAWWEKRKIDPTVIAHFSLFRSKVERRRLGRRRSRTFSYQPA